MSTTRFNRTGEGHRTLRAIMVACLLATSACVHAQAPAASATTTAAATPAQLDKLVAPIALYPDDLIAIILPGSTFPLQIVQADRYLDKRKSNAKLPVDETWDDSVKSLLNYPEVVKKMSTDLDWTSELGEAVVADQSAVLEAVQVFRRQVQSAGNLKSDDKQTVVVEKEVIKIVPADPQVIYVPQYNPSTVVVYGGYSSWAYYPAPYPVYYYPYPPGAAFATGLIWGAAISAAWHGGYNTNWGGGGNNNININHNTNINTGGNRVNAGNKGNAGGTPWKSTKRPGQVSGATKGPGNSSRIGDSPGGRTGGAGAGASARPSTQPSARPSTGGPSSNQSMSRPSNTGGGASSRGGDALGSYGSGRDAQANSSRGASSRQSMSSPQRSAGGGGARSGGGARGGGGRGGRR